MSTESPTRGPTTIGYFPWIASRLSALALIPLLMIHIGVQLYPTHGFIVFLEWGIYRLLLDLTLGFVLLHAFLGVRSTVIETRLSDRATDLVIWVVGIGALLLFVGRLLT